MTRARVRWLVLAALAATAAALVVAGTASAGVTFSIVSSGTTTMPDASVGGDPVTSDEFLSDPGEGADSGDAGSALVNRTIANGVGSGVSVNAGPKAKSNPELGLSFGGLNFFDQRFSNNGNQFSVEPPDQALCVGNGFVLESVNDVLSVYNTSGARLKGPVDLNTFYGYPAAINRSTGVRGPALTDPSCYFDPQAHRFVEVVLTLDELASGFRTGRNHLDIAVSTSGDPTGSWTIYKLPTQNDGTEGTPNHNCPPGSVNPRKTNPNACLADYPHIGADRNGIYLTTNEFPFFHSGFIGADIYAFSKAQLYSGSLSVAVTEQSTAGLTPDGAGFTVWPATTPGNQYSDDANGTEYFLSSRAVFADDNQSSSIVAWALSNTASLNTASPSLNLSFTVIPSQTYAVPPTSVQKAGSVPLIDCLNDPNVIFAPSTKCWSLTFGGTRPANPPVQVEGELDSSDSRFVGVAYANGKLWGTLGTAVTVNSVNEAAIGWFILKPSADVSGVSATLAKQGILAGDNVNYTYPSVAVTNSGRGVMGFTLVGPNDFPSAAYAGIDAIVGAGDVHVAAAGAGPQDGLTESPIFTNKARWGDYGAAVVDGRDIWIASEYIGQTCTYADYKVNTAASPFGTCGKTRGALGNWGTRISKITP